MTTTVQNATDLLPATVSKLTTTLFEALGTASTCWENLSGAGVFDSDRCKGVGEDLLDDVVSLTGLGEPSLGLATSGQLLEELKARLDLSLAADGKAHLDAVVDCLAGGLDYRTVSGAR